MTDARAFRDAIGHFPTGVTVVTASGPDGPAGLTTNAVTSVSLDPLLLLVCFESRSRTLKVVRTSRRFAVNVLRAGDEDLAAVFASKRVARGKFADVTHTEAHGVPVLDGALAWIAWELPSCAPAGDHEIRIGEVLGTGPGQAGDPLVFYRGALHDDRPLSMGGGAGEAMTGRVCAITGASSGLGYETALALARMGATVALLCRSVERGARARERIAAATGNDDLHVVALRSRQPRHRARRRRRAAGALRRAARARQQRRPVAHAAPDHRRRP